MFTQFATLWHAKWDKHRDEPSERWTAIGQFIDDKLPGPPGEMPYRPITPQQWIKAVRGKRSQTATGPDGVSKQDLLSLPYPLTCQLLEMFHHIEQGGEWPQALLVGLITAIEKQPHAHHPTAFRPICVLSMAYQTWASIRTKQILTWLSQFAPAGLIGNRSRKETAHIWWTISAMVERSWYDEEPISGCISDIVKCYSCSPLIPVFAMAKKIGIPNQILRPWATVITGLERRFVITGGAGPGLKSTTGFPEGDPLSVASMFLVNLALFEGVKISTPRVQLWSFVDNLETTGPTPEEVLDSLEITREFCTEFDIQLDESETICWATNASSREYTRLSGCRVVFDTRDLGGQLLFCRRHTSKVVRARVTGLADFWPRLARSPAPLRQKETCLRVAAWPKALHGISTTIFGADHISCAPKHFAV